MLDNVIVIKPPEVDKMGKMFKSGLKEKKQPDFTIKMESHG